MTPRVKLLGLVSVVLLLVGFVLIAVGARERMEARPAPVSTPTVKPSRAPVVIPEEARSEIWRSEQKSSGEFTAAKLTLPATAVADKTNAFSVEVETSVDVDVDEVAKEIHATLNDPRGWAGYGKNTFELTGPEAATLHIRLAAPDTVDQLCGADQTKGLANCQVGDAVIINSDRWFYMVPNYDSVTEYRAWAVNHEVGKWLGQRVAHCKKKGELAPAMADQATSLGGCLPNAWPKSQS